MNNEVGHQGPRGFVLRTGTDGLAIARAMVTFYQIAQEHGFEVLKLPLAHEPNTFIGDAPRPIRPRDAERVLLSHTPEGGAIALRYEGTAPTARYVAARSHEASFDGANLAYFDEMTRLEVEDELDDRHWRAFYQAGFECMHRRSEEHSRAIVNLLRTNIEWVRSMGADLKFRVSHVNLVLQMLKAERVRRSDARDLREALESSSEGKIEALLDAMSARRSLRERVMELAALRDVPLERAMRYASQWPEADMLEPVRAFVDLVEAAGLGDAVRFDAGILRSLNFYSGVTFQGDVDGVREVLGGGEYTGLAEAFGARGPLLAVGTAIGVERLMSVTAAERDRAA